MPRRGENIYKRKDGRWEGRYIKGYDTSGKAKYVYVYAHSYAAVKEKMKNISVTANVYDRERTIPDGTYDLDAFNINATMRVEGKKLIVEKGSQCLSCDKDWMPEARKNAIIENGILQTDVVCKSPSTAGWVVLGHSNNGWLIWKTSDNKPIDIYRKVE